MFTWLDFFYGKIGHDYARSWEIVNKLDDYFLFVEEVKTLSTPP